MEQTKTALQQLETLIEKAIINTMNHRDYTPEYKIGVKKGLRLALVELHALLPLDRQQIEQAYEDGCDNQSDYLSIPNAAIPIPNDYFNSKYGRDGK